MEAAQKAECTITLQNKSKEEQDIDSRGRVGISGSIDMHWPGRGIGRSYNSDSGASYLMGHYTALICAAWIFCKSCRTCFYHLKNKNNNSLGGNETLKPHQCARNFPKTQASKEMEPSAAVNIVEYLPTTNSGVFLSEIIMDDDTTTMAQLQNKDKGGKLCNELQTPHKKADTNHRIRGLGRQVLELADMRVGQSRVTTEIASRVKRNFAYWLTYHKTQSTPIAEVHQTRNAAVNHMFGYHKFCTPNCPANQAAAKNNQYAPKYKPLCMKMHSDIYMDLLSIVHLFTGFQS